MARKATGAQIDLAYVAETTWGTTPASPTMKQLRAVSESVEFTKGQLTSAEFQSHRQIQSIVHGTHGITGSIECEYGAFLDDWLEAAMYGGFVSNVLKLGQTLKQFTLERRLISIGQVERYTGIRPNGFTLSLVPEQIAKITFPVQGKTMTLATDGAGGPTGWLQNDVTPATVGDTTITIDTGTTAPAAGDQFTIYKTSDATDQRSDQVYTVVSYAANIITFTPALDILTADNDILHFSRPGTSVSANDPMNAFTGSVTEGGTALAIVTGIDMTVGQGAEEAKVIGATQAQGIIEGGVSVTGTLKLYVVNHVLYNKFVTEGYSTLQFVLTDGTVTHTWLLPRIKYNGGKINKPAGGGPVILEMPFVAAYDATTELTTIKITKS